MNSNWEFVLRLMLAGVLGSAIGFERKTHHKQAGVRTHFVVAVGSALMMIVSKYGFMDVINHHSIVLDPSRIAAQVVSGIGFLGAGVIIFQRNAIRGLTTAAGVWTTAGIGMAIGAGLYIVGTVCTVLVLVGFIALQPLEQKFIRNMERVTVTVSDLPGMIGKMNDTLGALGLTIEQISINRTDREKDLIDIELYILAQRRMPRTDEIIEAISELDGVVQVALPEVTLPSDRPL